MFEIEVANTPVDLTLALGIDPLMPGTDMYRIQNRGASSVYRAQAATAADVAGLRGFRHAPGSIIDVSIPASVTGARTWLWATTGKTASVIVELTPL